MKQFKEITQLDPKEHEAYEEHLKKFNYCLECQGCGQNMETGDDCADCNGSKHSVAVCVECNQICPYAQRVKQFKCYSCHNK